MSHAKIPMVDEDSFPGEVLAAEVPVLVEFGAKWCGPCRALEPILADLGQEGAGRWKVAAVDIDESPTLARTYGVRGAPTVIVFARGTEAGRHLGMTRRETLVGLVRARYAITRNGTWFNLFGALAAAFLAVRAVSTRSVAPAARRRLRRRS